MIQKVSVHILTNSFVTYRKMLFASKKFAPVRTRTQNIALQKPPMFFTTKPKNRFSHAVVRGWLNYTGRCAAGRNNTL